MNPQLAQVYRHGRIGTLTLPHRVVMGAMHLGIETVDDGVRLAAFYAARAAGGAGLIVTGGCAVNRQGVGGPGYSIANEPADQARLRRIPRAVHAAGAVVALQLFHAGRYARPVGEQPVAPSAVYSRFAGATPRELTEQEILQTTDDFARGAHFAREAGFDAVEVMASEGYLLNQFVSPLTNTRNDSWGGDAARRIRMPLEVLSAIRSRLGPTYPVIFRISGADLMAGSSTPDEILAFARELAANGVDALNVGVGWHESPVPTVQAVTPCGVWVRYSEAVKKTVGDLPVITSNRINTLELAAAALADGKVDYISMARPFLADPEIMSKGRRGRSQLINLCIGCNQACIDRSLADEQVSCMVNPHAVVDPGAPAGAHGTGTAFAVIGAGPAGLSAARELARSGARVDLFEAEPELGGQFRLARLVPGKADYAETIRYYREELRGLSVTIHRGRRIGPADERLLRTFDGAVVATGRVPRAVRIPGADLPHVVGYHHAFTHGLSGPRIVIIGGGGIAVDLAHTLSSTAPDQDGFLAEHGLIDGTAPVAGDLRVTILRRSGRIGADLGRSTRWAVLGALRRNGVSEMTGVRYRRITPAGVEILDRDGKADRVAADTVVIAAGQVEDNAMSALLDRVGMPFRTAGSSAGANNAVQAFESGVRIARELTADVQRMKAVRCRSDTR